ncbi:MAG: hypothetical protein EXS46_01210 [Candidatus Taylorbacteria bacterium]|nr:hypothetical protein [Candidatus Taylorbacteria bacterium]
MVTNELLKFIREQLYVGVPEDQIAEALKPGGWSDLDLEEAFQVLKTIQAPPVSTPPKFEHHTVAVAEPVSASVETVEEIPLTPIVGVINPIEIKPEPLSAFRFQTMPTSSPGKKWPIILAIAILLLLLVGVGTWFFVYKYRKAEVVVVVNKPVLTPKKVVPVVPPVVPEVPFDVDLIVKWEKIPDEQNMASSTMLAGKMISKSDIDFLKKYFEKGYDVKNLPDVAAANAVVVRNLKVLQAFSAASTTSSYQCSFVMTLGSCTGSYLRVSGRLLLLRSYILERAGKVPEALSVAEGLVDLGRKVTAQADDVLPLLIGWILQKDGYQRISLLKPKLSTSFQISPDEKTGRINTLRDENKAVFKFLYTREAEGLEYLADKTKVPSFPQTKEDVATADEYRKSILLGSFNLKETKKYFYDSYKTEITNIDAACGSTLAKSPYDFSGEVKTATTMSNQSSVENYIGKILYDMTFFHFGNLNVKRCEVEDLINKL